MFDSKRTIFVYRQSGCTFKHFTDEAEEDYRNEKHGDWDQNPVV